MRSRWSPVAARGLSDLEALVLRSRLLGAEPSLVIHGGGNTSTKTVEPDHRGRPVRVLRIKGSGSDLATATARDFPALRLDDLLSLKDLARMDDGAMVTDLAKCLLDPAAPRPSIETLLHAFLPHPHVDHTHPDAILALVNHPDGAAIARRVLGPRIAVVPYVRPGFLLSRHAAAAARGRPDLEGLVLDKHGLVTFGATHAESYGRTIALVTRAERFLGARGRRRTATRPTLSAANRRAFAAAITPGLRGLMSAGGRMVLAHDGSPDALRYAADPALRRASQAGPATPDHVLHLKPWPLITPTVGGDPARWIRGTARAAARWARRYAAYLRAGLPRGLTPDPAVPRAVIVPGLGLFASGRDSRGAGIALDLLCRNARIQSLAAPLGTYRPVTERDLCAFEYWPNERFKLTLAPPERELARRIALVTGAASGIGRACAEVLARAGAHVVLADRDGAGARREAAALAARYGAGRAVGVAGDITTEAGAQAGVDAAWAAWGGLDLVVSCAGIARAAPVDALALADWEASLAVNATGHFLTARAAFRVMKRQGLGGAFAFIGTKNVPAPGAEFAAYSASKAAQVQLARVLALEGGPHGIRVNIVNPDAIFRGSRLWSAAVLRGRARTHGIAVGDLPEFYAKRNVLRREVLAEDVAEAVLFLLSDRSAKTTGAQLPVDGGVPAAFPR